MVRKVGVVHAILGCAMVLFAVLWYLDVIAEPTFTILETISALILMFISLNYDKDDKSNVYQQHYGQGDNVGKDKVVK